MFRFTGKSNMFGRKAVLGIVLLTLTLTKVIMAQMPPAIHGMVTTENYIPIPNAEVIVFKYGTNDTLRRVNADYQGYFFMDDLPMEYEYQLWVSPMTNAGLVFPGQFWYLPVNTKYTPHTPIYLKDHSVFTVHIKMTRTPTEFSDPLDDFIGAIQGKVKSEFGSQMRDVQVAAYDAFDSTVLFGQSMTDMDGHFVMFDIPAEAPLHLKFIPPTTSDIPPQFFADYKMTLNPVFEVVVEKFNTFFHPEFILEKYPDTGNVDTTFATLNVTLFDKTNQLVMNSCHLSIMGDNGTVDHYRQPGSSDTTMVITRLREGNYSIAFEVDSFPRQYYDPAGNTAYNNYRFWLGRGENKEISVNLVRSFNNGKIYGRVENHKNEPVAGAKVCALDIQYFHHGPWINVYNFHTEYMVMTDSAGYYELSEIRPGEYVVLAITENDVFIPVFHPSTQLFTDANKFKIDASNFEHKASFTLSPGARVTGYVKSDNGAPLRNIKANLWENWDSNMPQRNFFYEVTSDENGRFTFPGMPEGRWHVQIWDDSGFYLIKEHHHEDIITQGTTPVNISEPIVMQAGGALYGKYTLPYNDSSYDHHIGRLFIYPTDTTMINDDEHDFWKHHYIGVHRANRPGEYKTDAIFPGEWKIVIAPNQHFDPREWTGKNFIPSLRWSFIDNALTFMSTQPLTIESHKKIEFTLNLKNDQGFAIKGVISGEKGELFGHDTVSNQYGKYFHVGVYIKDAGHFVQVGESYEIGNNGFVLSGLIDGREYYFNSHGEEYPDQWWIGIPDSATCDEDYAKPYTLSTNNFVMPHIYLQERPHNYHNHGGPPPVENFTITPVGLSSFHLDWAEPPPEDDVVRYKIYRIKDAKQEWFKLSSDKEHWDINDSVINEDSLFALLDSFSTTDTFFVDITAEPFKTYMYVVFGINSKGEEGGALPGDIHISHYFKRISYDIFPKHSTIAPNAWNMMGICGLDSIPLASSTNELQVFYWDEKADSSKLYSHYQPVEVVKSGQGVWVYTYKPIDLTMSQQAFNRLALLHNNIKINLQTGWNQVSSPFPYEIYPKFLNILEDVYEWDPSINGYRTPKSFKPWKAYWIKSPKDTTLALSSLPAMAVKRVKRGLKRCAGWELQISLKGAQSSDPDNFIGTLPVQLSKKLTNVAYEPPQAFDFPQLYFVNGPERLSKQYLFSNTIPEGKLEWVVAITPSTEDMQVQIGDLSRIPQEVGLFWIDKEGICDLRKNSTITINAHATTYNGMILATASAVDMALYSGKYMIKQNYPNPFRSATTIEFTVPYSWDSNGKLSSKRQGISLSVYNVAGQLVSTVYSGIVKVGHHRTVWDGKSNSGRSLPSGMYIARFESAHFTKSMRMFKVK